MNIVLFCSYLFISRYKRKQRRMGRVIMTTAIFMFLFSTTHVSLGFQRLIEGFIILRNQPGGPAAFFSNVSIPANVAKVCIHTVNVSRPYYLRDFHHQDWLCCYKILVHFGRQYRGMQMVILLRSDLVNSNCEGLAVLPRVGSKFVDLCTSDPYDIRVRQWVVTNKLISGLPCLT